jgi:hypothetical protein
VGTYVEQEVTMAGLRGDDEIAKAFADLQYKPGSKQKRRDVNPKAPRKKSYEEDSWDSTPIMKRLGGEEVEVFTIGALAKALEKSIISIRSWEKKGYIPRAPYRLRSKSLNGQKVGGNRVYTRVLIEIAIEEFSKRGLLGTARVEWSQHEDLTIAILSRWKDQTANES